MAKAARAAKAQMSKEEVTEKQAIHPTQKWYDIFEAEPVMATFPQGNETLPVITGYNLIKKLHPVFIEPHLAMGNGDIPGYNHHAIGNDHGAKGGMCRLYFLKDKFNRGDFIPWLKLAALIPLKRNHSYTQRLKAYEIWKENEQFENQYETEEEQQAEE